ncbi:sarcosine oxidase subunit gamma [Roseobacter sp. YSTF-M11]|uniref:Sarcosine oxidase subunit gamma n=1 Tax=Roseobacter insulae TaxID=2859783 RepID=A0A9X1FU90_9RHOB|nr:sarcosine oxidase subunit gamma [Roseobacter insulae]MBW4707752.1 sarcosine oxidase subunit gamma [Roseobacter insulae]
MVELVAKSPCAGLLPMTVGEVTLSEVDLGVLTSVAPFKGQRKAASEALKEAHGMALPAPNRATGREQARAIWFGRDMALLAGPLPDTSLTRTAALTDQSDAWACVTLAGRPAEDVLARLVPVDMRAAHFKRGHTVRTQIMHMNGSITRIGAESFLILAFRAMAATLVHDLKQAMEGVAARG